MQKSRSEELHRSQRASWLRAAVLGANDGVVSTSSLIVGVAAAHVAHSQILLSGVAGLVAGAMSMAAGEYVSVSSQADTEKADREKEKKELEANPLFEKEELARIYRGRGLDSELAYRVAEQLMAHDALKTHLRDELGITEAARARPTQAALASAASFSAGAGLPLLVTIFERASSRLAFLVSGASLVFLVLLGALAAAAGGASIWKGALRVGFWGALAMGVTALIGGAFALP